MPDDIRRWSDELARDPSSTVFIQLAEALRRQGQLDVALKIALRGTDRHPDRVDAHDLVARIAVDRGELYRAFDEWNVVLRLEPHHVGALKGMGFICFQQGRIDESERYLRQAAERGGDTSLDTALATVRRSSAEVFDLGQDDDPRRLFADLLTDEGQTALLLDGHGLVLAGVYVDAAGRDVSQEVGAELSGVCDEARRATRHLNIGDWRSIVVETEVAVVGLMPGVNDALIVFAASRSTPLGLLRRLVERCGERGREWLEGRR